MKDTLKNWLLPVTIVSLLVLPPTASAAKGPSQSLRSTNNRIHGLLKKKVPKGSSKETRQKAKLTRLINQFLDFNELARRSLGKHWPKRSAAEQKEFVDVLRQLIEHNYLKQLRSNLDYKVEYRSERVKGDKARVTTAILVMKNRREEEIVVEYKMLRVKRAWMVYDVVTDDVSIVRNYRSQFNRIIKKKSYKALLEKMRKKLHKLQAA
ncbi:MAG: ABC transporter substrate-binding protein [Deltaproteobacteria bacterium]|nr:ABC transporter substrate-binding protein [Deltaproteobacteria bacterium]